MSSAGERTQEATPRRKARARTQGNVVRSGLAACVLALSLAFVPVLAALHGLESWAAGLSAAANAAAQAARHPDASFLVRSAAATVSLSPVVPIVIAAWLAAVAGAIATSMLCGSLSFAPGALVPSLQRASWSTAARRLFSSENLFQAGGAAAAFAFIGAVSFPAVARALREIEQMPDVFAQAAASASAAIAMWWHAVVALAAVAALEIAVQRRRHAARLRMTPRELRDERAQTEAKPEVKQRRRAVATKRARGLRIGAIRQATVVVVNPTHVAVALRYAPPMLDVPTVVARGADLAVAIIRCAAQLYDVPIVSAPELARALYETTDVDEPIPEDLYAAVAAVFAWIVRTRGSLRRGDEASP